MSVIAACLAISICSTKTIRTVAIPKGFPLYSSIAADEVEVKTREGKVVKMRPLALTSTGKRLGAFKVRVALPRGRSLGNVDTFVVSIPPAGNAPFFAEDYCTRKGYGSIALQDVRTNDWATLASMASAVARFINSKNERARWVFVGFSAGGFAAHLVELVSGANCVGIVQVGSYPFPENLPANPSLPLVSLVGKKDFNLGPAQKAVGEIRSYGTNARLITHPGGHTWGGAADQARALEALGLRSAVAAKPSVSVFKRPGDELKIAKMFGSSLQDFKRLLGEPTSSFDVTMSGKVLGTNYTWGRYPGPTLNMQWNKGVQVFMALPAKSTWQESLRMYGLDSEGVQASTINDTGNVTGVILRGIRDIPGNWKVGWIDEKKLIISLPSVIDRDQSSY